MGDPDLQGCNCIGCGNNVSFGSSGRVLPGLPSSDLKCIRFSEGFDFENQSSFLTSSIIQKYLHLCR